MSQGSAIVCGPGKFTAKSLVKRCRKSAGFVEKEKEKQKEKQKERKIRISLLPAAETVLADLEMADVDYRRARFQGFKEEELQLYLELEERIQDNTRKILQNGSLQRNSL